MTDIVKRLDIESIYQIKIDLLHKLKEFDNIDRYIQTEIKLIKGYEPYRIDYRFDNFEKNREEKYIDRTCWSYLVDLYELNKYMLCTDYEKMLKEITYFQTPVFNIENANSWVDGLKELIYDNVKWLIKKVFVSIVEKTYYTGSGYSNKCKKKRNNNGIDKVFILTTNDYSHTFGYYSRNPTITDDLEKVCYILSGESIPKLTCKDIMRQEKINEYENKYYKVKFCKNGNTHYWLNDEIRNKLNYYGPGHGIIGENIRIKIFDNKY